MQDKRTKEDLITMENVVEKSVTVATAAPMGGPAARASFVEPAGEMKVTSDQA